MCAAAMAGVVTEDLVALTASGRAYSLVVAVGLIAAAAGNALARALAA